MDRQVRAMTLQLADLQVALRGDRTIARRQEPIPPSLMGRMRRIVSGSWEATSAPTATHRENYRIAAVELEAFLPALRQFLEVDLPALEEDLEARGGPWTPGRVPRWPAGGVQ